MSDQNSGPRENDAVVREALLRWEADAAVPDFDSVHRRIAASPSPLEQSRRSFGQSLRLTGALARAQLRIVPWLVVPVALVIAAMAVLAARFFGVSQGGSAAVSGFSSLMLVAIAVTVTMALSRFGPDSLSLTTPLGPQVVVLARVAMVLAVDVMVGAAASGVVAMWGGAGSTGALLAGWLVPLALIAGAATFLAIWVTPWAGAVIGIALVPLVSPPPESALDVGLGAMTGAMREAITPVGVVALGVLLLTVAVASTRRALAVGPRAI